LRVMKESRSLKILLAYLCNYQDRGDYYLSLMPVGLVYLASFLQQEGYEVILANFSTMGYRRAVKGIADIGPDIVGISLFTHNRVDSLRLARGIKKRKPKIVILAGGPHATFLADELIEREVGIDYILQGEAERSLAWLVERLKGGDKPQTRIIPSQGVGDLDALPPPSRFTGMLIDVDPSEQFKYIITSRGCTHRCTFCCSPSFWKGGMGYRSVESIVDELEHLHREYGLIYFSFRDDNFTLKKRRVIDFCRLMRERALYLMWNCQSRVDTVDEEMLIEMKRAGLEHIQYGVESGSERILRMYDKRISVEMIERAASITRRVGVYLSIYLMVGMEGETRGDIRKTISLIGRILPGDGIVSPVALYPGTELYNKLRSRNEISDSVWFKKKEAGIFLRDDIEMRESMSDLLDQLLLIRDRSWYRRGDFRRHREAVGEECWVTDILEGDYYLDEEMFDDAEECYERTISRLPGNPWGFFRMGKLKFLTGQYPVAEEHYTKVTEIVPAYFGGWLKLAESQHAQGNERGARASVQEAYRRNRFDFRIKNLRGLLR
jgi:anaerobic magnesium-protoporphyrin IX monomethyl ester cyclase